MPRRDPAPAAGLRGLPVTAIGLCACLPGCFTFNLWGGGTHEYAKLSATAEREQICVVPADHTLHTPAVAVMVYRLENPAQPDDARWTELARPAGWISVELDGDEAARAAPLLGTAGNEESPRRPIAIHLNLESRADAPSPHPFCIMQWEDAPASGSAAATDPGPPAVTGRARLHPAAEGSLPPLNAAVGAAPVVFHADIPTRPTAARLIFTPMTAAMDAATSPVQITAILLFLAFGSKC